MDNLKRSSKVITEGLISEYLDLCEQCKELTKRKDELRSSILSAYPEGGSVGMYIVFVDEGSTRSFPLDLVKAKVAEAIWLQMYEPFIKVTTYPKLTIKNLTNKQ